jgi:26S proteasome regulatory subunit N1
MAKATEFEITVQSDDPKKKEQPEDKDKAEGSSKQSKDVKKTGKEDEGEELVCNPP